MRHFQKRAGMVTRSIRCFDWETSPLANSRCDPPKKDSRNKIGNPDPERCLLAPTVAEYKSVCQQTVWQRRYWDHLKLSEYGVAALKRCPASTAGYQLFRQQALAEGIASKQRFILVVTSVAFDGRNKSLVGCLKRTGVSDFRQGWGGLFQGKADFKAWTHQQWVEYVRNNADTQLQKEWATYMHERYGY